MRKILLITFILLLSTQYRVEAIEEITKGSTLSVNDCIELAIKNSPQIKIYEQYITMQDSKVGQSKARYFPTIGASVGQDYGNTDVGYRSTQSRNSSARVSLNQLIYSFGKVFSQVKMQKFYKIAAEYDYQNAILDTTNNVKSAYYGVLGAKANLDIQKANVLVNERQYNRTKAFFDEGLVSKIDLVNQEVYLSDSKIGLINAENMYQNSIVKLTTTYEYLKHI